MECVELDKFLLPVFALSLLTTLFSHWRMKANAVDGFQTQIDRYPLWKKFLCDLVLPKSLLTAKGIIWFRIGVLSNVILLLFYVSYIYLGNQDWVCPLGPASNG